MTRRPTYGESMSRWERENDERHWKRSFIDALSSNDFDSIKELIIEGVNEDYDFPNVADPKIKEMINLYRNN